MYINNINSSALTGLRGFAVLLVLLAHTSNLDYSFFGLDASGVGMNGVYLFFSLSAFLLTLQMNKSLAGREWGYLGEYVAKRVFRIYPLFVFVAAFFWLVSFTLEKTVYIDSFDTFLKTLLLQDGPGIFWTICVEFKFYILLPVFVALMIRVEKSVFEVLLSILAFSVACFIAKSEDKSDLLGYLPIFIISSYLAMQDNKLLSFIIGGWGGFIVFLISILSVVTLVAGVLNPILGTSFDYKFMQDYFYIYYISCPYIVLYVSLCDNRATRFFKNRALIFMGETSYSIYLIHMIVIYFLYYAGLQSGPLAFFPIFISIILASSVVYYVFERPVTSYLYGRVRS